LIHPLAFLSDSVRKPAFFVLFILTVLLFVISQVINAPLRTAAAPYSIVSFELARTAPDARAMVASWDSQAQLHAAFCLGFDYFFMPSYAFAIALACLLASGRNVRWFVNLGALLGWGMFLAATFDAVENIGLWQSLLRPVVEFWPAVSYWCAIFKFTLIFFGIAYALIGWFLQKNIRNWV
jgi:hypothetical protein